MHVHEQLFIDGAFVEPLEAREAIRVISPSTEQTVGHCARGGVGDVDRAVAAARRAQPAWAEKSLSERAAFIERLHSVLTERQEAMAALITRELGMPLGLSKLIQVGTPLSVMKGSLEVAATFALEEQVGNSLVRRVPRGVVACITPWNYPLHQIIAKVVPALLMGCTVVLKPSEVTPLNALALAELLRELELPKGVFNVVTGVGVEVGEALVGHRGVDFVSFTGSTRAGQRIAQLAAANVTPVALELGGKSAALILDDADLKLAVKRVVSSCFLNSGQTCTAQTRLLVPRHLAPSAEALAVEAARSFTIGDPVGGVAKLGPLVSAVQRERVRHFIEQGVSQGARLLIGGADAPDGLPTGFYVKPTIFGGVTPEMSLAREEIFGPVLSILAHDGDDDAVRLANDSDYGLAGAVWSSDSDRALRVAKRVRAGQIEVNGGRFNPLAPFGGFKKSGYGREFGRYGLEEYVSYQSLQR